jgi:cyclopropane fatty-acyl-phospholipid synthase-like methyltransferase
MIQFHRHLAFPRNVYIHAVFLDEARLEDAHYGVFASPRQSLAEAQATHLKMMIGELPKPPARVLMTGYGVGTSVKAVRRAGYRVTVLTTDVNEARIASKEPLPGVEVIETALERFRPMKSPFEAVFAREVGPAVDMVTLMKSALPHLIKGGRLVFAEELPAELAREATKAAQVLGYSVVKARALGEAVAPTLDHFGALITKHRSRLKIELRMSDDGVDLFLKAIEERRRAFKSRALDYVMLTLLKS